VRKVKKTGGKVEKWSFSLNGGYALSRFRVRWVRVSGREEK
jgi:hypothetical protein